MSSRVPVRSSLLGAAPLSEGALTDFRRRFHGDVLVEGEPPYDEVRRVWNQMVDRRPAVIARCTGVADVRTALAYALAEGLDVTVRCGGHSIVGHGVADGAVLLDLAPMRGVRVDPDRRQVWVQGGARLRDLDRETHPFGLGVPVGVVGDTGVGGLSLGGGYGFATRRYGLTCDNLLAAEVVTADGELVVVDEEHDPELLWGLKGGGGNFGVVTGLTFRMHPLGPISYGDHLYPIDEGLAPLRALLDLLRDGPDEVTASAVVASAPAADWVPAEWQGRPAVMVSWVFHGPVEEGRRLCASLAAGRPVASAEAETTYAELQAFSDVVPGEVGRRYWKGALVTDLPDEALEMILRRGAGEGDREPSCAVELFGLGGAFGRVGDLDTAFGHRGSVCDVLVVSGWTDPADDEWRLAEARGLAAQVAQYADGAYVNSLEEETDADAVRSAYGATTFDRLTALKDRYDPANVFHHNQNVRPSAG